jgi:hypothetical protein
MQPGLLINEDTGPDVFQLPRKAAAIAAAPQNLRAIVIFPSRMVNGPIPSQKRGLWV